MMRFYEFHMFDDRAEPMACEVYKLRNDNDARSKGATLCKRSNGPVDIAECGDSDWSERYMTTAMPSKFHVRGVCFERLA